MSGHDRSARRRVLALAIFSCLLPAAGLVEWPRVAQAAEPTLLARSDTPRTVEGEGDATFLVDAPVTLSWRSTGGSFALEATAEGAERPAAVSATQGQGQGRITLRGERRYQLSVSATGPWAIIADW